MSYVECFITRLFDIVLVIFISSFGSIYLMGRKVKRYKRMQERERKRLSMLEKSLGIHTPPKKCPKCGTLMELKKVSRRGSGGVLAEGMGYGINLADPGSLVNRARGLEDAVLVCPNCGEYIEI